MKVKTRVRAAREATMRKAIVFLVMMSAPAIAAAQTAAHSFAELNRQQALKEGDTVLITCALEEGGQYTETEAKVESVTDTAITVRVDSPPSARTDLEVKSTEDGTQIVIPEDRVRRIAREHKDTVWNGAGIGAAVGGGLGAAMIAAYCSDGFCRNEGAGVYAFVIAFYAGIGFGVGAGVDAMIGGSRSDVVYLAPGSSSNSFTVSLSPILSRDRKGVLFSISW